MSNFAEKGETGNYFVAATAYIGGRILSAAGSSIRNKIKICSELEHLVKNK